MRYCLALLITLFALAACSDGQQAGTTDTAIIKSAYLPLEPDSDGHFTRITTGSTTPAELVTFAQTLKGIPYKYGSTDPDKGFDCSGFISYVFNHFNIAVPRQSVSFTTVHREIDLARAKQGDLILFTGTDSTIRTVGHMGIVVSQQGDSVKFIHSTSGKAYGVTESALQPYYMPRYVKVVRIFPQNDR